jgi:nucleoid-associated protein YgaU
LVREVIADESKPAKALRDATLSDAEEALEQISEILDKKVDRQEADDFRDFLVEVSESVAEAAGEGLLGMGEKVSKREASALGKIEAALKATEADKKARMEAEARAKREVEAKAKREAEAKAKREAVAKAKREAEAKATREAAAKAKREAAAKAKREAEAKAKREAATKAKREAEAKAKREAEAKAKREAKEAREKQEAEVRAKREAEVAAAAAAKYITEHTVVSGDTLSGLALKYYGSMDRDKWMLIYEENKHIIGDNPNLIRVGQVFKIPKLA